MLHAFSCWLDSSGHWLALISPLETPATGPPDCSIRRGVGYLFLLQISDYVWHFMEIQQLRALVL